MGPPASACKCPFSTLNEELPTRKGEDGRKKSYDGRPCKQKRSQEVLFSSRMQQRLWKIEKKEDGEGALIYKGWGHRFRFQEKPLMRPYLEQP